MKYGFFLFVFSTLIFLVLYTLVRGMQAFSPAGHVKYIYAGMFTLLFGAFVAGMFFGNSLSPLAGKIISFIGFTYLLILVYLFFSFLLIDIARLANHFFHFIPNISLFRMWSTVAAMGIIAVVMIIGNIKFNNPQIVTIDVTSSKLSQGKELKIVAVSDLHLGISIDKKRLKSYVDKINAQHPDLVLFGGDLIDRSIKPVVGQKMDEELRNIQSKYGVFGVFGNHEYFGEGGTAISDFYNKSNITLLQDSSVLLNDELYIIGRKDKINSKRKALSEFTNDLDRTKPMILLDHQPFALENAENLGVDFQFSGHTHNGQFFPGNLIVKRMFEKGYGYLKKGNTHYYISSGLGIWGPQYRIGSQSELVVVTFRY